MPIDQLKRIVTNSRESQFVKRSIWIGCMMYLGIAIPVSYGSDDGIPMDADPGHTWKQSGYANMVKKHAKPTNTPAYDGYWVGGSSFSRKASGPGPLQGTDGRDYFGKCFDRIIVLGWKNREHDKVGTGSYATDGGPRVRNVLGFKLPEKEGLGDLK